MNVSRVLLLLLLLSGVCGALGCQVLERGRVQPPSAIEDTTDRRALAMANQAFRRKEYMEASRWFGHLVLKARSPSFKRAGLYGLACTKMVLSKDKTNFDHALEMWKSWADDGTEMYSEEDPRLLYPVLERFRNIWILEGSVHKLKEELDLKENQIKKLREKLKALEEIDRAIQRKKLRLQR